MEMNVHLNEEVFYNVLNGTKTIEGRLNDEKRRELKVGDKLIFINRSNDSERIFAVVEELKYYNSFIDMVDDNSINELLNDNYSKDDYLNLIYKFYSKEEEKKYGVVAIKFRKI